MQNDLTFTRAQAAEFASLLDFAVESLATGYTLADLRAAFADFVNSDESALAWFDWELGLDRPRYRHATLSNGTVISERVSG